MESIFLIVRLLEVEGFMVVVVWELNNWILFENNNFWLYLCRNFVFLSVFIEYLGEDNCEIICLEEGMIEFWEVKCDDW